MAERRSLVSVNRSSRRPISRRVGCGRSLVGRLVGIDAFSQAFTSPLLSEHLFNEKTFSDVGWDAILTTTTLSQLIHRNIPQPDGTFKVAFYRNN